MQEIRKEISEEAYNKYAKMSYKDRYNELIPTIPDEWVLGYGYYGHGHYLTEDGNGKYYIVYRIGSSCD